MFSKMLKAGMNPSMFDAGKDSIDNEIFNKIELGYEFYSGLYSESVECYMAILTIQFFKKYIGYELEIVNRSVLTHDEAEINEIIKQQIEDHKKYQN